jgi:hypothetical protein
MSRVVQHVPGAGCNHRNTGRWLQERQIHQQIWELCIYCGVSPQGAALEFHHHCHQGWLRENVESGHSATADSHEINVRRDQLQLYRHLQMPAQSWENGACAALAPLLPSVGHVRLTSGVAGADTTGHFPLVRGTARPCDAALQQGEAHPRTPSHTLAGAAWHWRGSAACEGHSAVCEVCRTTRARW